MPYEDEDSPYVEPDRELDALAHEVIGAAIEVHRELGAGLEESLYRNALMIELPLRQIEVATEVLVDVQYKGRQVGTRRIDLLVGRRLVVELKAVDQLARVHTAQVITYLKIMKMRLGLLINFNVPLLRDGLKRIANPSGR